LGQCTRDHCMIQCIGGESPACQHCTVSKCVPAFESCSGITDVPSKTVAVAAGNDADEHGCALTAGYSWCEHTSKCARPWEEKCEPVAINTEVATATACSADDMSKWSSAGKSNFDADMTACGKCMGTNAITNRLCVGTCIAAKEQYTTTCASCFGDLGQCTRDHCMIQCIGGESPACQHCTVSKCVPAFESCSGITDVPSKTVSVAAGNDADEHGCVRSAGYSWCDSTSKCIKSWEEKCEAAVATY
jgi:hypothetical protein